VNHGTYHAVYRKGCRCDECEAWRVAKQRAITEMRRLRRLDQQLVRPTFAPTDDTPCLDPANDLRWWTHDEPEVRREAAALCSGCPVIAQCYAHGKKHKEFGVWGGVDLTTKETKERNAQ
jgi:hypothetical protein